MTRLWLEESEAHSSDVKVYIDILKQEQAALAARTQKKVQAFGAAYMKQVQEMRRVVDLNAPLADERQEKSKHKGEITKDEIEENKKLKKIWRYLTKLSHADPRLKFNKNSWRDDFKHFADRMLETDLDKVLEDGSPLFDKDVIHEIGKYTADDAEDVIKRIKEIADGSSSPTDKEDDDEDDEDDDEEKATGGKKSRRKRTKRTRTTGGKKSRRRLRKRTTLKGGKRKRRRTRRRR